MKELNGYALPFDFSKLTKKVDLIEMDGPLLSLYQNEQGECFLFYWVDADEQSNRWMLIRVQPDILLSYLRHEIPLRQVLVNPSDAIIWFSDRDASGEWHHTRCMEASSIPEDYLPEPDAFYEFGNALQLEKGLEVDKYELTVPVSDRGFFEELVRKMGWKTTREQALRALFT